MLKLPPGTIIDGRFVVEGLLGQGGMGVVYKATQSGLHRDVALKILLSCDDPSDLSRFEQEAKILCKLEHPGIPGFFHFGRWENLPYLVMEYVEGRTISERLRTEEKIGVHEAIRICIEACSILQFAHEHGVVHRDLTSNNLFITASGAIKIMDFGLSLLSSQGQRLTRTGAMLGSLHYMSPEQCLGKRVDHRADIYALACVLFQMVEGHVPVDCDNPVGLLHKHAHEDFPAIQQTGQPLIPSLNSVLRDATHKGPSRRFQSMNEFSHALSTVLDGTRHHVEVNRLPLKNSMLQRLSCAVIVMLLLIGFVATARKGSQHSSTLSWQMSNDVAPKKDIIGLKALLSKMRELMRNGQQREVLSLASSWKQSNLNLCSRTDLSTFYFMCGGAHVALGQKELAVSDYESAIRYAEDWMSDPSKKEICLLQLDNILLVPKLIRDPQMVARAKELLEFTSDFRVFDRDLVIYLCNKLIVCALSGETQSIAKTTAQLRKVLVRLDDGKLAAGGRLMSTAERLLSYALPQQALIAMEACDSIHVEPKSDKDIRRLYHLEVNKAVTRCIYAVETKGDVEKNFRLLENLLKTSDAETRDIMLSVFNGAIVELRLRKNRTLCRTLASECLSRIDHKRIDSVLLSDWNIIANLKI